MGLLDSTQDATDTALAVMASQPLEPEKPTPKHSAWTVIPRAVGSAFLEAGGNLLDTASDFGQVAASVGGITPGFDPSFEKNRAESLKAAEALKKDGINWRSEEGQSNYNMAEALRPDPITAGAAENIIFGLTKGLTKAASAATVMGPVGGAAAFGISEGITEAEKLAREGVDIATRTKVGVVNAGMNTVGMALPAAGNTLAKTLALAFAGGPASFIAQQAATRSILEHADYHEIAKQYDPLDPVGLTIATLLPAGFGAIAYRGARASKNTTADAKVPGSAEIAVPADSARPGLTPDHIDAAMVQNLTIARDISESRLGGVGRQIAAGVVDTANGISESIVTAARSLREFIAGPVQDVKDNKTSIHFGVTGDEAAARIFNETGIDVKAGSRHEAATNAIRHAIGRHPDLDASDWDLLPWVSERFDRAVLLKPEKADQGPRIALAAIDEATGHAYVAEYQVGRKKGSRLSLKTLFKDTPGNVNSYLVTNGRSKEKLGGGTPDAPMNRPGSESPTSVTVSGGFPIESPGAAQVKDPHISNVINRANQIHASTPDMPVAIKEDGTFARAKEEIEAIRRQAKEGTDTDLGTDDAPLVKVAAECLLSRGG